MSHEEATQSHKGPDDLNAAAECYFAIEDVGQHDRPVFAKGEGARAPTTASGL
jgi:hypothetical protein